MPPLFQEQKHQALVFLRSGNSTHKVVTLGGMSQSFATHMRKDVGGRASKASCRPREEALCHSCY